MRQSSYQAGVRVPKQLEAEHIQNRKFLQAIIDAEPECVKLLAVDGTLLLMNPAGLSMIQADSFEQVNGTSIYPLILPEHLEAFKKLTENVFQGTTGNLAFELVGLKGRRLWVDTHVVPLRDDNDEIVALLGITRNIAEHRQIEEVLKKERDFTATVLDTVGAIVLVLDREGRIVRFNRACEEVSGYTYEEVRGRFVWDFLIPPEQVSGVKNVFKNLTSGMFPNKYDNYWVAKDGQRKLIAWSNTALLGEDGSVEYVVPTGIDISERKRLEDQLRQSQKMESIGTLAGGIAHDFNNILTAIIGYGNLLQMKMRDDDPLLHNVEQILASANRAANLTLGLLAYSRKQILNPQPVNLNEVIRKVERLLVRLIGEDVELKTILDDHAMMALADAGQIEQVLMNLATNARDAMPDGGYLYIETRLVDLNEEAVQARDLRKPGAYAEIAVTDSGAGMDEKLRERIFEPFFTTKESGKGTGLGLAMAYGIIKQHNGSIEVESEIGRGSTFRIHLPLIKAEAGDAPMTEAPLIEGGTETILVAEDDETVRNLTCSMLQQFGYTVILAADGEEAVNKFMANRDQVRMLLLDVIMPKKNGKEVYDKIRIFNPDVKALFLSGYTADIIHRKGLLDQGLNCILKPVQINELLKKIRMVLDARGPGGEA
jgi:PAS domain S-box-containing protein